MLNTYIQNRGLTQTRLHNKRRAQVNEIQWDATYDGEEANISVSSNTDGAKQHYEFKLDNQDLETMLNIPSVDIPLHTRLQKDFTDSAFKYEPVIYQIELPRKDADRPAYDIASVPIEKLVKSAKADSYLSSPLPNEELILPLTIDGKRRKKYTLTPKKHHFHRKSHRTYRAYKKRKSSSNSTSRSKSRTTRKNI
jgi:hypothetical protein